MNGSPTAPGPHKDPVVPPHADPAPSPHTGHQPAAPVPHHPHDHAHQHGGWRQILSGLFNHHAYEVADSVDDALAGSVAGLRAVQISLLGLGLTAIFQLGVAIVSGSVALLADTVHNFADALTAVPLWLAFVVGRRPRNRRYTYGYGRAEDLAGIVVVVMIAVSAAIAAWESIQKLIAPQPIGHLGWVALAALVGFIGNELVAQYRIRTGRRIGSAALEADGYHARTDGLTSLAVLAGVVGVWLGFPLADPLVGLLITSVILFILKDVSLQIWQRLMDAVDPDLLRRTEEAARTVPGVRDVAAVRARWIGHTLHAEVLLTADSHLTLAEAHEIAEQARHAMMHAVPKLATVTVHVDPGGPAGETAHAALRHHDERVR